MNILFLLGDNADRSIERQLAKVTEGLIGKDARVTWYSPERRLSSYGRPSGVWIFTHDEDGGCPEELLKLIAGARRFLDDVPVTFSGIGGKDGAMNALTEIDELLEKMHARVDSDAVVSIPLRGTRFEPDSDERMDIFWQVDEFVKYCGMDDSESRKIAFKQVVENYFDLLKYYLADGDKPTDIFIEYPTLVTDMGRFDCEELPDDAPDELTELHYEIESLTEEYEFEVEELLPALLDKVAREW